MILLVDNYDSFVHNLARYFRRLGQETLVVRNDAVTTAEVRRLAPRAIVLSPGPCTPNEAGNSCQIVLDFYKEIPLLGVCLGHQSIAAALGAKIVCATEPMHGRTSPIWHNGKNLFAGLPSPLTVCRYHSLVVEEASLPDELTVTANTPDGTIMAFEHVKYRVYGVQFHPEATLTQNGYDLLANFLKLAGVGVDIDTGPLTALEFSHTKTSPIRLPRRPVTF